MSEEYVPKILTRTQFGDPILQEKAQQLTASEIAKSATQKLIADIRHTLISRKYGVGLAAPQVGVSLAISVISIKKTPVRQNSKNFEAVIINPSYRGVGKKQPMWEGCLSFGAKNSPVFAQAERYAKIQAVWLDENGTKHAEALAGLAAHVFQHETDHLDGILFTERVEDHSTWMNASEYKKRIVAKRAR